MQFPVPQFIDVEDKIIGPFTLKQFGIIFIAGLIDVALFRIFKVGVILFLIGLPVTLVGLVMAFGQFNGKKLYDSIPLALKFLSEPKQLVFHKAARMDNLDIKTITVEQVRASQGVPTQPEESPQSKLKNLTRLLEEKNEQETQLVNKQKGS
ncbi:MAG: Uncharacterized protein G01um101477_336 [Candidatus Doudnabacteria bacterium Gr01-1014_77]|uniref:PrgI family protein n=1 Tax=Candidatus Doudnabacteria bacterium Gr01-1014_77 TaxID=2017133 RepID=A0A554JBN4_9BACT|nr:MAG: Uncharacterized protein G01um101477_336 [Candidatus Doudnabacteria bacterium Gr01-1014_77]